MPFSRSMVDSIVKTESRVGPSVSNLLDTSLPPSYACIQISALSKHECCMQAYPSCYRSSMQARLGLAALLWAALVGRPVGALPATSITEVSTVSQFLAAIEAGAAHIEVTDHLDLTAAGIKGHPDPNGYSDKATKPKPSTHSIRVRHCHLRSRSFMQVSSPSLLVS